jgi:hypothetical protein
MAEAGTDISADYLNPSPDFAKSGMDLAAQKKDSDKATKDAFDRLESDRAKMPEPAQYPDPADMVQAGQNGKAMAGLLMAVSVFGSAKMGIGVQGAINAMAGGLKGYSEGQHEAYAQNMEKFKANVEQVKQHNEERYKRWHDLMTDDTKTVEERMKEAHLIAVAEHDHSMVGIKTFDEMNKKVNNMTKLNNQLTIAASKAQAEINRANNTGREKTIRDYLKNNPGKTRIDAEAAITKATKGKGGSGWKDDGKAIPEALKGIKGEKGKDRYTDKTTNTVWDWNYTTSRWETK